MKKVFLVSCFVFYFVATSFSQDRLTTELLWKLKRITGQQVSGDGKQVVFSVKSYSVSDNKGTSSLYTVSSQGGSPKLVADSSVNGSSAVFSPDGKRIYFLATVDGTTQLWEMNTDGSNRRPISKAEGGISDYGFSPQGDKLWYTTDVKVFKTVREQYPDLPKTTGRIYDDLMYRHWDEWADENFSHVFYASYTPGGMISGATDLMPGEPYDSPLKPFGGAEQITWSPDGKIIAYTCKKLTGTAYAMSTNSDVFLYEIANGKTTNISDGMMGYDKDPAFSPDGTRLTWLSMQTAMYEADRNRIFQYDFKTGTKTELTQGFDYTVEAHKWSPDGNAIYFTSGINATDQLWIFDPMQKAGQQIRQITRDTADITSFTIGKEGKNPVIITSVMSISMPTELFRVDLKTGKSKQITGVNQDILSGVKMGTVARRMVKATDGKEILTWVIYPPGFDPEKKYPALLYCQGGPQSTVSQFFSYRWNFQLMAANGYIVVAPNRRGLPSFGTEWNRQISGDWGGQAMKDLLSAIDDVSKESYVDKDKLGAVGASFGGYSVYWLAGNHNNRFKAFIAHDGVFDLTSMYGTTEELFFADFDMGGPYFRQPRPISYTAFNPVNFAKNWDTPILIIHNDLDFRVPISQGMEAFTAARAQGVPARFLSFPDENHWMLKPQNSILWQRVFFDWLEKYVK